VAEGTFEKVLEAKNASVGAVFSGTIQLNNDSPTTYADKVSIKTNASTDKLNFTGAIIGGDRAGTLTITGPGVVTFSGAATYNNSTVVSQGTLLLATTLSGTGNMTVSSGARLIVNGTLGAGSGALLTLNGGTIGGSGSINRAFTVGNGSIIAPGNSIGKLSTVNQTWASGGVFKMELGSVEGGMGVGWDGIDITGSLAITATQGSKFILKLSSLNGGVAGLVSDFDSESEYHWKIVTTTLGITDFDANKFYVDTSGFENTFEGAFFLSLDGNDLMLNYTAVPEPSTYVLLGAGAAACAFLRRGQRARRKQAAGLS